MVVNYDLPPCPSEYIHRVGRTGRAGRPGRAVTLWTDADLPHLDAILEVIRRSAPEAVDEDLQRLVQAWKARKAKQFHIRATGGVLSQRKGERKLAAKVIHLEKKKNRWVSIILDLHGQCVKIRINAQGLNANDSGSILKFHLISASFNRYQQAVVKWIYCRSICSPGSSGVCAAIFCHSTAKRVFG